VLALVAASAFAISVQAGRWWTAGDLQIGPFGSRACFGGECSARGLGWIGGGDLWLRSAIATGVAGLVAMLVLVGLAGAIAGGRAARLLAKTSLVAIATAAIAGVAFVARFPGAGDAHLDIGAALYAIAIATGVAGAVTALRRSRHAASS
jgi:hypothetical protein